MRGASSHTKPGQTIEFKGHLIDSLTLSKIADRIEQRNGSYELNDIRIGVHRQDISALNMTVFADTAEQLSSIVEDLKPYGAVESGDSSAELAACLSDGEPPAHAFNIRLPQKVLVEGQWLPVENGQGFALAVDTARRTVRLAKVEDLRAGEQVVIGNHGIVW